MKFATKDSAGSPEKSLAEKRVVGGRVKKDSFTFCPSTLGRTARSIRRNRLRISSVNLQLRGDEVQDGELQKPVPSQTQSPEHRKLSGKQRS